jgi:hypothetical protein
VISPTGGAKLHSNVDGRESENNKGGDNRGGINRRLWRMTGQIAGPSTLSLELVGAIIGVSMIAGAVDVLRQPSWAWKRAEKNEVGNFILVLLVPLVGLGIYLRSVRPRVAPIAAAGKAASFPFEQFGKDAERRQRKHRKHRMEQRQQDGRDGSTGTPTLPAGFASFSTTFEEIAGATAIIDGEAVMIEAPATDKPAATEVSGTFFSSSSGGSARASRLPGGLTRGYRPRQRTSVVQPAAERASVPSGWKADPTGRHQFRFWDGSQWTENVADDGNQTLDSLDSMSWSATGS